MRLADWQPEIGGRSHVRRRGRDADLEVRRLRRRAASRPGVDAMAHWHSLNPNFGGA